MASPFVNLAHLDIAIDDTRHPKLKAYIDAMLARPSFAAMIGEERRILAA